MRRILLVLGAAILFLNTLVVPTMVRADGNPPNNTSCGGGACKP